MTSTSEKCDITTDRRSLHTPGPWSVEDPIDNELTIVEANKPTHEWKFIATVYLRQGNDPDEFPHHVSEANARLIAAAPDLLILAKKFASECAECDGTGLISIHVHGSDTQAAYDADDQPCPDCHDIRVVITKAEGRS